MAIKLGINGFGRIGRTVLRIAAEKPEQFEICGVNLRKAEPDYMAYLMKYDSVFGRFPGEVEQTENGIRINGRDIAVFSANDSKDIPWDRCGAEYIVESTGAFNTTELSSGHLAHGAAVAQRDRAELVQVFALDLHGIEDDVVLDALVQQQAHAAAVLGDHRQARVQRSLGIVQRQLLAEELHLALGGVEAHHAVGQADLALTGQTADADDLALAHVEIHIVERLYAGKDLRNVIEFQYVFRHAITSA